MSPTVTVITATTGNPLLEDNIRSINAQTYEHVDHMIIVDGPEFIDRANKVFEKVAPKKGTINTLPFNTGKDRYNGHLIYGAGTYLAKGDYFIFLDDDNSLQPTHIEDCVRVIQEGSTWSFSFRNIVDRAGHILCQDNCESLGMWPSVIHPQDYFIDVNCYFLPKMIAVAMSPVWHCKFREPGQPEIDRKMMAFLRHHFPNYDSTYKYTVNYTVGNTALSVTPEFFTRGNAEMLRRYNGNLPWKKI